MSARVAIVHIDYDESSPLGSYRGSYVTVAGKETFRAVSSEPDEDVMDCYRHVKDQGIELVMCASSVDNYFIDIGDN